MRPRGPFGEGCRRSKGVPLAYFPRQRGSKYTYKRKTFDHTRALLLPYYVVFLQMLLFLSKGLLSKSILWTRIESKHSIKLTRCFFIQLPEQRTPFRRLYPWADGSLQSPLAWVLAKI